MGIVMRQAGTFLLRRIFGHTPPFRRDGEPHVALSGGDRPRITSGPSSFDRCGSWCGDYAPALSGWWS